MLVTPGVTSIFQFGGLGLPNRSAIPVIVKAHDVNLA